VVFTSIRIFDVDILFQDLVKTVEVGKSVEESAQRKDYVDLMALLRQIERQGWESLCMSARFLLGLGI
jgi:hypothetical protein